MHSIRNTRQSTRKKRRLSTDEDILNCFFAPSQEMDTGSAVNVPSHSLGLVREETTGADQFATSQEPQQTNSIKSETIEENETNSPEETGILYYADNAVETITDEQVVHWSTPETAGTSHATVITLSDEELPPAKVPRPDPLGRGKQLDDVWSNFHRMKGQPESKVTCNHCKTAVSSRAGRLRKHKQVCKGSSVSRSTSSVPDVPPNTQRRSYSQTKVTSYIDVVTSEEKKVLDYEMGKYIFATNLPFSHVEHPRFLKMVSTLRPGYKPPKRQTVGTSILDHVHRDVISEIKSSLGRTQVTLMQDGWKSRSQDAVIAHCITTGEHAYFLNAVSAEENEKTDEYCVRLLLDAIKLAEERYNAEVIAVVTDNCNSMRKMRSLIVDEKPEVLTYGCHPHLLNLVGKKLTPCSLKEKIEIVHKFFRNHDAAAALLKKNKGTRPVIACTTRWNSWIMCFESYLRNQTKFLEISRIAEAKMANELAVVDILNDRNLYREVELTVSYLKPIQRALDRLQASNATLADGVASWIQLQKDLIIEDLELSTYFERQFGRAVTDVGIAAYMLNPKYKGKGLSSDLVDKGNNFLSSKAPFALIIASQIQQESSSYFSKTLLSDVIVKSCTAVEWWHSVKASGKVSRSVVDLAIQLMKLPAGSADIERHFSTLGNILNERRTRLGIHKAEKLCLIYKHLAENSPPGDDGDDWLAK